MFIVSIVLVYIMSGVASEIYPMELTPEILNCALELDAKRVLLLQILVLGIITDAVEFMFRLGLSLLEFQLHAKDRSLQIILLLLMAHCQLLPGGGEGDG